MTDLHAHQRTDAVAGSGSAPQAGSTPSVEVARVDQVPIDRGVAALLGEGAAAVPVALFRLSPIVGSSDESWYAVGHVDPHSGAPVMARGLVGSAEDDNGDLIPTVASPLLKQRYDLRTGRCLDSTTLQLPAYEVTISDGRVFLAGPTS